MNSPTASAAAMPALPAGMRFIERDWLSANGVLFDDGQRTALVDTGYVSHRDTVLAVLQHLLGGRALDLIVNTHLHSDHCGGNALLQHTYGCRTLIPASSAQAVRDWDTEALTFAATGQRCDRFDFHSVLNDGDEIELGGLLWRVMAAPGHDPDMVVLHCRSQRVLISADALWENGFGVIFPELEGASGFAQQRAILERIGELEVDLVIPGHGPMFRDVAGALARAHSRLDHLSADPARNARHATKVMLKFLLLEQRRVRVDQVAAMLDGMSLITTANRLYLGLSSDALAQWAIDDLVRAGAARIDGDALLDR
jgi:glyoxylase-like metal-dependent hydrolase (beta-lactamase superfamily II)